jgi:hypothetical protein
MEKAVKKNPSFESFRDNEIHEPQYSAMDDRSSVHDRSRIRRSPNGELDYKWVMNTIVEAIHKAETGMFLTPIEESLLTVFFPLKFPKVEAAQAEIRTQLSRSEKAYLKDMIDAHLKEELNYNAGRGGGSVPGRGRTITE